MSEEPDQVFRLAYVPGVTPAKWMRVWIDRMPDVPILFFSGYADTAALEEAVGNAPLLRKPFRPSELAAAIRALLDGGKVGG